MTKYTYISSIDYINNLSFSYIETFSFQRGRAFEENLNLIRPEYEKLKIKKRSGKILTEIEEKKFLELDGLLGYTQYVINEKGQFHPSTIKTHTYKGNDPQIENLKHILQANVKEVPAWMCAPIYRDAIVFYDQDDKIVSTLNVCLGCQYMATSMFNHINADNLTYDLLRRFFINIGHKVEETE